MSAENFIERLQKQTSKFSTKMWVVYAVRFCCKQTIYVLAMLKLINHFGFVKGVLVFVVLDIAIITLKYELRKASET